MSSTDPGRHRGCPIPVKSRAGRGWRKFSGKKWCGRDNWKDSSILSGEAMEDGVGRKGTRQREKLYEPNV